MEPTAGGALIDPLLDFILANVRQNVASLKTYQKVPVHDLVKKLEAGLSLASLSASLKASKGSLSDLTTMRRVGNVTVTSEGNSVFIALSITLDFLELDFDKYTLQLAFIKLSGDKLRLTIKKNLFDLFLVIHFNGLEVDMYFDKFKLSHFSDIDVEITGFGVLNPVARKVADWIVDYFNDYIVKEVAEPYAKHLFNSAISDNDFLRRLFGYAISGMVRGASSNRSPKPSTSEELTTTPAFEEPPVAPVRQRRHPSSLQKNNLVLQQGKASSSRSLPPRQNNIQLETAAIQRSNNSLNAKTPDITVRNNLAPKKNEIFLETKKTFPSRSPKLVDADHILPLKPPML